MTGGWDSGGFGASQAAASSKNYGDVVDLHHLRIEKQANTKLISPNDTDDLVFSFLTVRPNAKI